MRAHVIVAFVALVTVLLICAATGPIDKGAEGVKWDDVRGEAKHNAKEGLK